MAVEPKQITDKTMEPTAVCSEVLCTRNRSEKENETEQVFKEWTHIMANSDFIFTSIDFNSLFGGGWNIGDGGDKG